MAGNWLGLGSVTLTGPGACSCKNPRWFSVRPRTCRSFAPTTCRVPCSVGSPPGPCQTRTTAGRSGITKPSTASIRSFWNPVRRNSPSVKTATPAVRCRSMASRIAASSTARSPSASSRPSWKARRASCTESGRSRLPTWSARKVSAIGSLPQCDGCMRRGGE